MIINIFRRSLKFQSKYVRNFVTNERKVSVRDLNINIVECGSGSKSVLLMPGALGSARTDFEPQIKQLPELLKEYTVIAWDPPGYGKSKPPRRNFDIDFFHKDADCAKELMEKLDRKKFSILGWSDGGITGLILASKYVNSIDKLVIWGTNSFILPEEIEIYKSIRDVNKWSKKMREPMEEVYGIEEFAKLWSEWVDTLLKIYQIKNGNICKDELPKIKAQTLVLHGKKDPMVAAEHIPYLLKHIKNANYVEFPNGKHNIHLRYANEFNEIVKNFLYKND